MKYYNQFVVGVFVVCLAIAIISPVNAQTSSITVEQNNSVLTISASANNVSMEFYDNHQVLVNNSLDNLNATAGLNVTIPDVLSYIGGYYRIAYINESVSSQAFNEILPWDAQDNGGGINNPISDTDIPDTNETESNSTGEILPNLVNDDPQSIAGEWFVVGVSGAGAFALRKRGK